MKEAWVIIRVWRRQITSPLHVIFGEAEIAMSASCKCLLHLLVPKGGAMTTVLQLREMHACDLVFTRPADAGAPDNIAASSPSLLLKFLWCFLWSIALITRLYELSFILWSTWMSFFLLAKFYQHSDFLSTNFRPDRYVTYIEILFNKFQSGIHLYIY